MPIGFILALGITAAVAIFALASGTYGRGPRPGSKTIDPRTIAVTIAVGTVQELMARFGRTAATPGVWGADTQASFSEWLRRMGGVRSVGIQRIQRATNIGALVGAMTREDQQAHFAGTKATVFVPDDTPGYVLVLTKATVDGAITATRARMSLGYEGDGRYVESF